MGAKKKEALEQFNRDNILTAAEELFSSKGVDGTTMDDIAVQADYSKSTIYVYFKSKEDIYNSILARRYADLIADSTEVALAADDYEKAYYKLCYSLVDFEAAHPSFFATLMGDGKATNSRKAADRKAAGYYQDMSAVFRSFLEEGVRRKLINKNSDIDKLALFMWTSIAGAIRYSGHREHVIRDSLKISKEDYLKFCFEKVYVAICG